MNNTGSMNAVVAEVSYSSSSSSLEDEHHATAATHKDTQQQQQMLIVEQPIPPPSPPSQQQPLTHSPSRPKLRRKAMDAVPMDSTVNQRLVEYICVVTSQPRWKKSTKTSAAKNSDSSCSSCSTPDASPNRGGNPRKNVKQKGSGNNSNNSSSGAFQETEKQRESRQPSPDDNGNIHMPQHDDASSANKEFTFLPTITARYPATDYADNPLNPMILQFCYPAGDTTVVTATPHYAMPRVHHFVLTLGCGRKLYGTCLTVLEEYDDDDETRHVQSARQQHHRHSVVTAPAQHDGIELMTAAHSKRHQGRSTSSTTLYIPKVLCLLSTWPYLTAFREYLSQLYRLAVTTNVMTAPLERYIVNLCCEIPAPPPGAYEIQLPILDSIIRFWAPPAKLPIAYTALPYHTLFECLDIDHVLTVWTALVLERKVLLISSQYSVLTVCAEILCSLLFPLRWSHLYVPLLPRMLCPILDAPVPYLCGIVRENWLYAQQFVASGAGQEMTMVVDLDRNTVQFLGAAAAAGSSDSRWLPARPVKKWSKLQMALTASAGDVFWRARGMEEVYHAEMLKKPHKRSLEALRQSTVAGCGQQQWEEKLSTLDHAFNLACTPESLNLSEMAHAASHEEQSQWDRVQEAFLRFFVALLKDYRKYLVVPQTSNNNIRPSFDQIAFVAGMKLDNVAFVSELCNTQHFGDFLSKRMYSPGEPDLVFFDQSIDAKLNRSKLKLKKVDTPFLHAAKVHKELTKLHAVPPNEEGLPFSKSANKIPYTYKKLPETFDTRLFCTPRPIPKMISAEFDRQAILVSKLRANLVTDDVDEDELGGDDLMEFYGGDYDPSPEVASFTVFLFVYSSIVGQDWQKYSQKRREEEAKKPSKKTNSAVLVKRDAAAYRAAETMQPEAEAVDSFLQDVSFGCCGGCTEDGVMIITSTLTFIGTSAEDVYNTYFGKPVDHYANLAFQEERHLGFPETDAAVEEYEEAREVAAAQLEVAFETLATMSLRGLSVDSDAYLSLMEACGRCGDRKRALKLIELMKKDGFVVDSEILSCFIAAFAHNDLRGRGGTDAMGIEQVEVDAYSRFVKKRFDTAKGGTSHSSTWFHSSGVPSSPATSPVPSDDGSEGGSDWSSAKSSVGSSSFTDWMHHHPLRHKKKKRRRKRKKRKNSALYTPVTEMISRHFDLGKSLLDFVYPDLVIDTNSDSCPHCSNTLTENDVVDGWKPCAFQDYTTQCPECHHRFVPRFVVTCSAPNFKGSQGNQTPLYCEFLSPWVLRKEFQPIIKGTDSGIDTILDPEWRSGTDIRATLFWNLVVCCRRYRLPFTFLLQGSFHNRLILPRKPDEI